jgi:hypothetical protein
MDVRELINEFLRAKAGAGLPRRYSWLMKFGAGALPRRSPASWPRWRKWAGLKIWSW